MSTDAKEPIIDQLQPEYSSQYMSAQGFTPADVENVRKLFGYTKGWSGGAKVLGKLPMLGRPTNLDYSRTGANCALQ